VNKSISHLIKCLSETVSVFLSNRDLLTRGGVFALSYLRKTSLSKEGFSMSHFILFAALSLNKNLNVNGALFPNFVAGNIFPS
jgi:hypothetical protein